MGHNNKISACNKKKQGGEWWRKDKKGAGGISGPLVYYNFGSLIIITFLFFK